MKRKQRSRDLKTCEDSADQICGAATKKIWTRPDLRQNIQKTNAKTNSIHLRGMNKVHLKLKKLHVQCVTYTYCIFLFIDLKQIF